MATEERDDAVDRLLDLFLYAPIGMLATGTENLDEFVIKGRQRAAMARTLGSFAVSGADAKIGRSMADLEGMAREFLRIVVENTSPRPAGQSSPNRSVGIDDLIAGYDDLTAKQIIVRLDSLDDDGLAVVDAYERSNRNRSTVLARIGRLRT